MTTKRGHDLEKRLTDLTASKAGTTEADAVTAARASGLEDENPLVRSLTKLTQPRQFFVETEDDDPEYPDAA